MVSRLLLLVVFVIACKESATPRPPLRDDQLAWHRVVLFGSDASEVAFLVGLPRDQKEDRAVVISGIDRVVTRVVRRGESVRVEFPVYSTALVLDRSESGYRGNYEIASAAWGTGKMPLRATPVAGPTIAAQATLGEGGAGGSPLDLKEARTVWRMKLGELAVKLVLDQRAAGSFDGTMYFDNGNVAYFGGNGRGDRLLLAGFEGASPFSLDLVFDRARAKASGTWRAGHVLGWKEAIEGERTADFSLGTKIALDGQRPALHHAQLGDFDGQPLIVELAATWCSTCRNIAPTLRALYTEHRSRGLKMVSLLYELTADPAANKQAEVRFKTAHDVPWPVRAVAGEQEDLFDVMPEGVKNVDIGGFPVVIFRYRDGTIAGVHSGFPAEGTGAPHHATVEKFRRLAGEILAR